MLEKISQRPSALKLGVKSKDALLTGAPRFTGSLQPDAVLRLAVRLVPPGDVPRLPSPAAWTGAGASLPEVALDAGPSAAAKVALALDAATGRLRQRAGAFA